MPRLLISLCLALLVAILLVALGTIIAAAVAYDNAMTARRGRSKACHLGVA